MADISRPTGQIPTFPPKAQKESKGLKRLSNMHTKNRESEEMQIHNLKVSQAARLMGKSEQFVRIGLQRDLLQIGTCFKKTSKSKYSYHISAKKFMEYTGITMEEIAADYQEHNEGKV